MQNNIRSNIRKGDNILVPIILAVILVGVFSIISGRLVQGAISNRQNKSTASASTAENIPAGIMIPDPAGNDIDNMQADQAKVQVIYKDGVFSPDDIVIKSGTTVEFVNQGGKMWVGSDPHPVHTDYPEFDQKQTVGIGESFSFTFTRKGEWGFHNHVDPRATGKVIVR